MLNRVIEYFSTDEKVALINNGATYNGTITTQGDVWVDGVLNTELLSCRVATAGIGGIIEGNIQAETVHVYGTINGNIQGCLVVVHNGGRVQGDILYKIIEVESGSIIEGCLTNTLV